MLTQAMFSFWKPCSLSLGMVMRETELDILMGRWLWPF